MKYGRARDLLYNSNTDNDENENVSQTTVKPNGTEPPVAKPKKEVAWKTETDGNTSGTVAGKEQCDDEDKETATWNAGKKDDKAFRVTLDDNGEIKYAGDGSENVPRTAVEAPGTAPDGNASGTVVDGSFEEDYNEREPKPTRGRWNEQIFQEMNKRDQLSEEEMKKLRRREIAQKAIAGFGDIATAAVNMAYANKGATPPAVPQGTPSMSGRYADKWAKWYEDYKQNREKYRVGLENARKQDEERYRSDMKLWQGNMSEERRQAEYELRRQRQELEAKKAEAELAYKNAKDEREQAAAEDRRRQVDSAIRKNEQMAEYYRRKPTTSGGNRAEKYAGTFEGVAYKTEKDYRDAVIRRATELNVDTEREVEHIDGEGHHYTTTSARNLDAILADIYKKTRKK